MGTSVIDYVFNNLIVTHTDVVNVNALIFFTTRTKDPQLSTAPLAKFWNGFWTLPVPFETTTHVTNEW